MMNTIATCVNQWCPVIRCIQSETALFFSLAITSKAFNTAQSAKDNPNETVLLERVEFFMRSFH